MTEKFPFCIRKTIPGFYPFPHPEIRRKMIFTDTHFHLCEDITLKEYIGEAEKENVKFFLLNTGSLQETQQAACLAKEFSSCMKYTAGIHPGSVSSFSAEENRMTEQDLFQRFLKFADDPALGAVGEIGIDLYYGNDTEEKQTEIFRTFLHLALQIGKPAVIHCRDHADSFRAYEITYALLKEFAAEGGRFDLHCYAGTVEWAKKFLDLGGYFGIGGMLTFKKADNIRQIADFLPLDRILLETDAPYLAPVPYRGKPNRSKYIPVIAEALALLKKVTLPHLAEVTTENAQKLFSFEI